MVLSLIYANYFCYAKPLGARLAGRAHNELNLISVDLVKAKMDQVDGLTNLITDQYS